MSNYKRIIESFNPYTETNEGFFDKDTREKRREERKEKRSEKGFNDGGSEEDSLATGKFKISSYIKAVTALKNNIIATLTDVDQHVNTHPNLQAFKDKFKKDLVRAAKVLGEISYLKTKEGNRLENDEDQELIKGYKDIYNSLKNDFEGDSVEYKQERDASIIKALKDMKFSEIGDPLKEANKIFGDARELLDEFQTNLAKGVIGGATVSKDTEVAKKEEESPKGALKIKETIKKGAKKNDEVKRFQQLLIDKFGKNKDLLNTDTWKTFAKYGADGNFGNGTGNVVLLFKKLYKLNDKTSSITQELIDKITAEAVKESLLLSFNSFLDKKNGVSEQFDASAIASADAEITKNAPATETKKKEIPKLDAKKALAEVKPEEKKVITDLDAEAMYKKAKEEVKNELKLEDTEKALKNIKGVFIVDGFDSSKEYKLDTKNPKKGYFAKCKGLLFFQNNICIRTYDGMIGWYDAETGYYKGKDGWREKISDMIKRGGVPKKMKYFFNEIINALNTSKPEEQEIWNKLLKTDELTIKSIINSFKWMKTEGNEKVDLISRIVNLREKGKVKEFYTKYKKTIDSLT